MQYPFLSPISLNRVYHFCCLIKQAKHLLRNLVLKRLPTSIVLVYLSFRLLDDEDDLGNYVEDPKLRRPVGTVSGTTCPDERANYVIPLAVSTDMHQEANLVVHVFPILSSFHGKSSYCMHIHFFVAAYEHNFYFKLES